MRMKSGWALLVLAPLLVVFDGCGTSNTVTNSGTGFMWVATQGDQRVTPFTVNLSTGTVSQVGNAVATGAQPVAMVLTPDAKNLFVANRIDNTISSYGVNSDGSLTAQGTAVPTSSTLNGCTVNCGPVFGQTPVALTVDPASKFLFVADQGAFNDPNDLGAISVFSISGNTLTPVGPACPPNYSQSVCPVVVTDPNSTFGTGPSAIIASPAGNFLYVANQFNNSVSMFSYDTSGVLTQNPVPPVATGNNPSALAFSRCAGITTATTSCPTSDGNNLFVADSGSNQITVFAACIQASATCGTPNGTLAPVSGSPFGAGVSPVAFMIHPTLNFVYAVNSKSNQVSQYKYSSATGALTPLSPAAASTGSNPVGGGITSNGAWGFVTNNGGSTLTAYSVGTGGQLNPAPTASISLSGQPSAIVIR
jgi:6-phosphogluconolactonase (cycloisomerase 2 family)